MVSRDWAATVSWTVLVAKISEAKTGCGHIAGNTLAGYQGLYVCWGLEAIASAT